LLGIAIASPLVIVCYVYAMGLALDRACNGNPFGAHGERCYPDIRNLIFSAQYWSERRPGGTSDAQKNSL
jgi:hypothetical protein